MHAGLTGSCRESKSYPQPRTGWRICGGGRRMGSVCCARGASVVSTRGPVGGPCWRSCELRRGFRRAPPLTLQPGVLARPIAAVRCSGTSFPLQASLHAICEAGLVPFSTFHQYLDSRRVLCRLLVLHAMKGLVVIAALTDGPTC
jgi:hypothetical protein